MLGTYFNMTGRWNLGYLFIAVITVGIADPAVVCQWSVTLTLTHGGRLSLYLNYSAVSSQTRPRQHLSPDFASRE
ncbi:hypothetical protein F9C07_1628487 [Aspergillus flavus]|uniref:Uncharacterized protein n=1 Tax=Aspergillus flavus (strain ATCC 200026 / FGSC A1120 / IAM 13836 / NRRL 3357 / JCM 12722 / SRRC 167) TaxID=332952 RepID=A0A7U2MH95_ASPFN|nr:hypothetical protein F9C07_1628487 [Aspergillus flavus]